MRKRLTIALCFVLGCMLLVGLWFANLLWYKPFNINQFYERVYIEFLWNDPEALSQTGVLVPFGITSYESELTDASPATTRRLAEVGRSNLNILRRYNREKLDAEEQVSYDALLWFLEVGVEGEPFLFHDYPVTQISGPHIDIPQFMRSHPLNNKRDIENYLLRLEAIDDKFGSLIDGLEERRKLGIVAPTFIIQSATQYCNKIMQQEINSSVFYTRFEQEITSISLLNPKLKQKYLDECVLVIQETVLPAYKRLNGYLMQLERSSLSIAGVWQLPQGNEYYKYCLLQNTGLRNSPDELYEIGKMEMSRLRGELAVLLELVGKDVDNMDQMLISQVVDLASANSFPNTPEGRAHCIEFFKIQAGSIDDKLEKYFSHIPTAELQVLEVPEQSSNNRPLAFYIPPRGTSPSLGKMYVNTWKAWNLTGHLAKSYAFHEGIPGHHLQKGIQSELNNLPTFRRFIPFEAYTEGWAMYAEQLGHEMTESEDPWDRIGLIKSDLFRTARMMTDIGIHHKKWLRQQAVEFMVDNAGLSESEAKDEVDRYIVWPGQGCAYKVGQLKFFELRALAEIELKEQFDIREFHQVLIGQGAMPLKVLEERVREYIAQAKENTTS